MSDKSRVNRRIKSLVALHILLVIYSLSGIFSKNASFYSFLSWQFVAFYAGTLMVLAIYAIGWQQILKRMPLTVAFANKAITVVWGMLWGFFLFDEGITWQMVIGAIIVIAGVVLYSYSDETNSESSSKDVKVKIKENV